MLAKELTNINHMEAKMITWLRDYFTFVLPIMIPMLVIGAVYAWFNNRYKISYRFFKFFKLANRPILKWLVAIIFAAISTVVFREVIGLESDKAIIPTLLIILFLVSGDEPNKDASKID